MENKTLQQKQDRQLSGSSARTSTDWKWVKDREEELKSLSPVFHQLERPPCLDVSPQAWRELSLRLKNEMEQSQAPLMRTLRDKLTATDSPLLHWLVIALALLLVIAGAAVAILMLGAPSAPQIDGVALATESWNLLQLNCRT